MKIITRKSDSVIIYGTNDNSTTIEVIDGNLLINGDVIATNVSESDYDLIENTGQDLRTPFYVGYMTYINGVFNYSSSYIAWNSKTHNCLDILIYQYYQKSEDDSYSEYEREQFRTYAMELEPIVAIQYLEPTFEYPCPPDELFPFYPLCSL